MGAVWRFLGYGGAKGDRTPDLLNAIQTLYQLSYGPGNALAFRGVRAVCYQTPEGSSTAFFSVFRRGLRGAARGATLRAMSAFGTLSRGLSQVRARLTRTRAGFTLVETLVALAVAGAVCLPSVVLVRRLLAEDRRLDAQVADNLRRRETPVAFPSVQQDRP